MVTEFLLLNGGNFTLLETKLKLRNIHRCSRRIRNAFVVR